MAIPFIAVGDKIKASIINKIIGVVNGTALNGIVPTSVDGATVSPAGKITVTNATSVGVNGVFSGSYDNYRITWNFSTRSTSGSTQFRFRSAATDVVTNYDYTKGVDSGSSRTVSSSSSGGAIPLDQGVAAGQTSDGVIDLYGVALSQPTTATVQSTVLAASNLYGCVVSFANENNAAYDGFSLYILSGGTFSGTVRVYGYNTLT